MGAGTGIRFERQVLHPCRGGEAWSGRAWLANGRTTSVHVAAYPRASTRVTLHRVDPPEPIEDWARASGHGEAINGGFFTKPELDPLGLLVVAGVRLRSTPFRAPWDERRGALGIDPDGAIHFGVPAELEAALPQGSSVLQCAPMLVRDGRIVVEEQDPEGLSTTCGEFDSDITDAPYPRMAIAVDPELVLAAAADGRSDDDDGLTLPEWAHVLVALGATDALNLDGGSSSALVTAMDRRNRPRADAGELLEDGCPSPTAVTFDVEAPAPTAP